MLYRLLLSWLIAVFTAGILSGCGTSQRAVIAEEIAESNEQEAVIDDQNAMIDSLRTETEAIRRERDGLAVHVARLQSLVDSLRDRSETLFLHPAQDSLRRDLVLQVLRGQEINGALRGQTLDVVFFESGGASITEQAGRRLVALASTIRRAPASHRFLIEGHSDATPFGDQGQQNNRRLSANRATAVQQFLVERSGLPPERFETAGYGAERPLVPNDTPANRRINRRVRIAVVE